MDELRKEIRRLLWKTFERIVRESLRKEEEEKEEEEKEKEENGKKKGQVKVQGVDDGMNVDVTINIGSAELESGKEKLSRRRWS